MTYTITANQNTKIDLSPKTVIEEVIQNISMVISTPQYTVPLDRGFGLPQRFIDKPIPIARTILVSEVMEAIEKYEPRALVKNIKFVEDDMKVGKMIPQVEVIIRDGK